MDTYLTEEIEKRIETREVWTYHDCQGLATEFKVKTRYVIGLVFMKGKEYVDAAGATGHTES